MLEYIILGIIQGIVEWLPVSSEGTIVLVKTHFFYSGEGLLDIVKMALFLHLGTFLAALVYFFKDVKILLSALFQLKSADTATKNTLSFLVVTTLISGILGFALIKFVSETTSGLESTGKTISLLVGVLLLGTGWLELQAKKGGKRQLTQLNRLDSIILGLVQGLAALPGFSRSGLTVSALLLRKIEKSTALKLSFLMSLPIVLAGNIILNISTLQFSLEGLAGLISSFIFGLLTIHGLLKLAKVINFGYFVLLFGGLVILSVLI